MWKTEGGTVFFHGLLFLWFKYVTKLWNFVYKYSHLARFFVKNQFMQVKNMCKSVNSMFINTIHII